MFCKEKRQETEIQECWYKLEICLQPSCQYTCPPLWLRLSHLFLIHHRLCPHNQLLCPPGCPQAHWLLLLPPSLSRSKKTPQVVRLPPYEVQSEASPNQHGPDTPPRLKLPTLISPQVPQLKLTMGNKWIDFSGHRCNRLSFKASLSSLV